MTDLSKILDKAKELEAKMKESQEKIKNIKVAGISGTNSVKVTLDGEGEMQKIEISNEILKDIVHNKEIHISKNDLNVLIEIEFANTLEQTVDQNEAKMILDCRNKIRKL